MSALEQLAQAVLDGRVVLVSTEWVDGRTAVEVKVEPAPGPVEVPR